MSNFINVDNMYYALCTKDDATGVVYGTPKSMGPTVKVSVDPAINRAPFYADGIPQEYAQVLGEIKVSLDISTLPIEVQADLLGHSLDSVGGIIYNKDDKAPNVAILYRRKKINGKYRYIKIFKCLFGSPKSDAETQTASAKPQNDTLDGVAMPRAYDGKWRYVLDEEGVGYASQGATFFNAVESGDSVAPTISTTAPANNATGVSANTTYVWTFSESLAALTVNTNNFYLIKDADGSIVPATVAYNDAAKTVTLTPSSALSATSKYIAVADADVTDLAGNHLVPVNKIFTTA